MHARALKRVLEHPEELLKEATWARCSTLIQESFFESLQVFPLQLESLLKAIIVLKTHTAAQIVVIDAGIGNFNRLGPGLVPVF